MGSRSNFERVEKDFYRTIDKRAVAALLPFLEENTYFTEPCAGQGDLLLELEVHGHKCVSAFDVQFNSAAPRGVKVFNALGDTAWPLESGIPDCVITNPPWTRKILHAMIEKFANRLPTWLLFDSNWANTKQSSELLKKYCTDIVPIGRLIWIPGTKMSGKDDCAWYRFSIDKSDVTKFHGR